jgi:hypothetical protein
MRDSSVAPPVVKMLAKLSASPPSVMPVTDGLVVALVWPSAHTTTQLPGVVGVPKVSVSEVPVEPEL